MLCDTFAAIDVGCLELMKVFWKSEVGKKTASFDKQWIDGVINLVSRVCLGFNPLFSLKYAILTNFWFLNVYFRPSVSRSLASEAEKWVEDELCSNIWWIVVISQEFYVQKEMSIITCVNQFWNSRSENNHILKSFLNT